MTNKEDRWALSRRRFGTVVGTAAAAAAAYRLIPGALRPAFAAMENPADIITGKSSEMLIHNAKLGVMETPLTLLRKYDHTPKEILFSRLHFPHEGNAAWYATTAAPSRPDWTLRIDGLVARPREVSLADLEKMDQVKRVSVLQCAGNGRSFYAAKQKVAGGQWLNGGLGNVEWEGIPLRHFLDEMQLMASSEATWLTAEGWDQPATKVGSDFAKSYHMADPALDNAIIALKMNGEPIPAVHGGPMRLIIPGYYGNMNVKFLSGLMFMADQSPSAYQSVGYRFPLKPVEPGSFSVSDYNTQNSKPTYGHKIKSVIFSPLPEDNPKAGTVSISGVAFNDGQAPVTMVEVSADGGKTWKKAALKSAESPWAWYHWSTSAKLVSGRNVLMSRATDALGRTQPMDGLVRWNPKGYEWNGVEHLELQI
jgi:DMSO/TMAO reductase YedYZ molybdopterin-dependent catalytic subunit